jgi:hypothetical protein
MARKTDLIWFSRWNVIKVTFLLQRYLAFLDAILLSITGMYVDIYKFVPVTQGLYSKLSNHTTQFILNGVVISEQKPALHCYGN